MPEPRVLIVGAGVAGLVTHIALSRAGISSAIYERASQARLSGGPLWLWTNAVRVLDELGFGEELRRIGTYLEHNEVRTWEGDTLYTIPVGDMSRRHGAPSIIVPRQSLLEVLLAAVDPKCLHLNFEMERWECPSPDRIRLFERQGGSVDGSLLVGADGIRSTIRAALLGDGSPRSAGQVARVGLARLEHELLPPGIAMATLGVGKRFWAVALRDGSIGWYGILAQHLDEKLALAPAFEDAHEPISEIIQSSDPTEIVTTELFDRPPTRGWSKDNVVLVGDAIHPATPDLGQGACQAIESAACLASWIARAGSEPSALRRALFEYEAERAVRSAYVSRLAKMTSVIASREEPWLRRPRERAIAWTLPWTAHLAFDYILSNQTQPAGPLRDAL